MSQKVWDRKLLLGWLEFSSFAKVLNSYLKEVKPEFIDDNNYTIFGDEFDSYFTSIKLKRCFYGSVFSLLKTPVRAFISQSSPSLNEYLLATDGDLLMALLNIDKFDWQDYVMTKAKRRSYDKRYYARKKQRSELTIRARELSPDWKHSK